MEKGGPQTVKFIALLSVMCRHYRWQHDFWRRMGRREFNAWIAQLEEESKPEDTTDSWSAADRTDHWEQMREKRRKWRGR